jgi:hypothetical protein
MQLHPLRKCQTEKLAKGLVLYLFLKEIQINYIISDNVRICIYYLDVNWLIPKISAYRARIWSLLAIDSYSTEQADIFQYQSYLHSDDIFIILKSNIITDIWYVYRFRYLYFRRENSHISKYSRAFIPSKYAWRHSS